MGFARVYRPKSFLKLILMGFGFVALPLIFGLMHSALYVGRLSEQSQRAVYQAVQATRSSQMLIEQLRTMERSARQFLVLGDKSLFQAYTDVHQEFGQTVDQLDDLPWTSPSGSVWKRYRTKRRFCSMRSMRSARTCKRTLRIPRRS